MEEQAQKRNTDCLYFLASPLTCKKGSACEYRHSDSARLNPRDCWYWLSGSCRNPNCAFRHPPLEGFNGVIKADSFYTPSFSVVPTSKLTVPCYFYFNAICAKGEQCPYLHDSFPSQNVTRVFPEAAANYPLENKISNGDSGPSVELLANPPAESLGVMKMNSNLKEVSHQAVPSCALEECSPSTESIELECDGPADNPFPSVKLRDHNSQLSPYHSSEELAKESVEQELDDRWESSPGFDVLVNDGSEQLAYEDDVDYQLAQNRESELLHSHLLEYDFDGSACYDHIGYPDTSYLHEGLHEKYDHTDDIYAADYFQHSSHLTGEEIIIEPMYDHFQKQKSLRRVHEFYAIDDAADLREHLKKHRRMDARWLPLNSRKRRRSHAQSRSQERPTRRGINDSVHCMLASQVGRCMITTSNSENTCKDHDRRGWQARSGTSKFSQYRLRRRERRTHKKPSISAEVQQSSAPDADEAITTSNGFAGPKTLTQIKEEKSRSKANFINSHDFLPQIRWRQATVDFEGPKPLEELLKDKGRSAKLQTNMWAKLERVDVSCQVKNRTSDAELNDWHQEGTSGKQDREFVNGCQDDESGGGGGSDDDDVFRAKLPHILSH